MTKNIAKTEKINNPVSKHRKTYDADFKSNILEVWRSGAYATLVECAKSYNIPENTLSTWLYQSNKDPIVINTNIEIASLKKELAKTKMELDILKKAAIYFANHAR